MENKSWHWKAFKGVKKSLLKPCLIKLISQRIKKVKLTLIGKSEQIQINWSLNPKLKRCNRKLTAKTEKGAILKRRERKTIKIRGADYKRKQRETDVKI